jgi:hypothetical protein
MIIGGPGVIPYRMEGAVWRAWRGSARPGRRAPSRSRPPGGRWVRPSRISGAGADPICWITPSAGSWRSSSSRPPSGSRPAGYEVGGVPAELGAEGTIQDLVRHTQDAGVGCGRRRVRRCCPAACAGVCARVAGPYRQGHGGSAGPGSVGVLRAADGRTRRAHPEPALDHLEDPAGADRGSRLRRTASGGTAGC